MEGIKIEVTGNIARVTEKPSKITAGTVGLPTEFAFDSQWDGLKKMAVFRTGHFSIPVEITEPNTIVPWEVLEHPKGRLSIGVHGVNEDGSIAIPTIWANVGVIHAGAIPEGGSPADPTPPAWKRIEDEMRSLRGLVDDMSLMKVTVDSEKKNASHNASQIYEHIQGGGTACLIDNYIHYPLIRSMSGQAEFGLYDQDEDSAICYIVFQNGKVDTAATDIVDDEILREKAVFYHEPQSLTDKQKAQARDNIDAVAKVEKEDITYLTFERGTIDSSTGKDGTNNARLRTGFLEASGILKVEMLKSGYQIYGHFYDVNKSYISSAKTNWLQSFVMADIINKYPNIHYCRVVVKNSGGNAIAILPTEVENSVQATYKIIAIDTEPFLNTLQSFTDEQKAQARAKIGAASAIVEETNFEKYFDIDDDAGLVSLKLEYRGIGTSDTGFSVSDRGQGNEGSKIAELPERLVIPQTIGGVNVTGFQKCTLGFNHRIKEVVIPETVESLPNGLFFDSFNLKKVEGTEQITSIGTYTFRGTSIESIRFPNLTTLGIGAFRECSLLRLVDIGQITTISNQAFLDCDNLSTVLGGAGVTSIGDTAFVRTRRLKGLPFLSNVTSVGGGAFYKSRCNFEKVYEKMVENGCSFGTNATYKQFNTKDGAYFDYWSEWFSEKKYTPCETPLKSLFHQQNPLWANLKISPAITNREGQPVSLADGGCAFMVFAEIYSAFEDVHLDSPLDFKKILDTRVPGWDSESINNGARIKVLAEKLGYTATHYTTIQLESQLDNIYNALKDGALIYRTVGNGDGVTDGSSVKDGHAVLCYGVNADGELLIADSNSHNYRIGIPECHKSASHIYTHGSYECDVVIVRKPN